MLLTGGCAGAAGKVVPSGAVAALQDRVALGMARPQVEAAMGGTMVVGYDVDPVSGQARPITMNKLFSSEIMTFKGIDHQVDQYLLKPPADGKTKELYPVVYKNGVVVGKGPEALERLQAQ
jgi:hypothetical protein